MTDTQLYLAIGVPAIALVLGMIGNGFLFNALSARITSLETRMPALETSVNRRIDLLIGKIYKTGPNAHKLASFRISPNVRS